MKHKATLMALSGKVKDKEFIVLDKLELKAAKTKEMAIVVDKVVPGVATALLLLPETNATIQRAGRNLSDFKTINVTNINVLDLLNYKYLVVTCGTVEALNEKYGSA